MTGIGGARRGRPSGPARGINGVSSGGEYLLRVARLSLVFSCLLSLPNCRSTRRVCFTLLSSAGALFLPCLCCSFIRLRIYITLRRVRTFEWFQTGRRRRRGIDFTITRPTSVSNDRSVRIWVKTRPVGMNKCFLLVAHAFEQTFLPSTMT